MELEFIGVSAAQKADLEAARSLLAQQQEEEHRMQAIVEAEFKKRAARLKLCAQADQLAREKATHQIPSGLISNNMPDVEESFSDWATLEVHDDNSVTQACIRKWTNKFTDVTYQVAIQLRLKDAQTAATSVAETVLQFGTMAGNTFLLDNVAQTDAEVLPESEQYAEVQALLKELETAEYEVTQQPLIGS